MAHSCETISCVLIGILLHGVGPSAAPAGDADKTAAVPAPVDEATPMDEDALLQQALAMSMQVGLLSSQCLITLAFQL